VGVASWQLAAMRRHPAWAAYAASLPVAGVDGSLAERMRGTPAEGVLTGKTGTLSGVSSLAGYVGPVEAPRLAYAIMINGFVGEPAPVRAVQDRFGAVIAEFARAGAVAGLPASGS